MFSYRALAIDSDGVFTDVTTQSSWVSAEAAIVRGVDGSPQFRAIDQGTTEIFASYRGFTAKAPVTVLPAL